MRSSRRRSRSSCLVRSRGAGGGGPTARPACWKTVCQKSSMASPRGGRGSRAHRSRGAGGCQAAARSREGRNGRSIPGPAAVLGRDVASAGGSIRAFTCYFGILRRARTADRCSRYRPPGTRIGPPMARVGPRPRRRDRSAPGPADHARRARVPLRTAGPLHGGRRSIWAPRGWGPF